MLFLSLLRRIRRRRQPAPILPGPATLYGHQAGAYGPHPPAGGTR